MVASSELAERVVEALARLAEVGEVVEDEWTYVHDLETVWSARIRAVAAGPASPHRTPEPELGAAIDRLVEEASRISDPHRAIDWLSTLPQAALVAFGEPAW